MESTTTTTTSARENTHPAQPHAAPSSWSGPELIRSFTAYIGAVIRLIRSIRVIRNPENADLRPRIATLQRAQKAAESSLSPTGLR